MAGLTPDIEPAAVGLDQHRLGRLDAFLDGLQAAGRIPGWQLLVGRHGQLAYARQDGWADIEAGLPVTAGTLFRIYSMTKPVTAVAAMILYERGEIELSDPLERFIPSFGQMRVFTGGSCSSRERSGTIRSPPTSSAAWSRWCRGNLWATSARRRCARRWG